jgi:hypothetical protein
MNPIPTVGNRLVLKAVISEMNPKKTFKKKRLDAGWKYTYYIGYNYLNI